MTIKTKYFTKDEMDRIIGAVNNLTQRTAIKLGFATGTRVNELLSIKYEDIDRDRRLIKVFDIKKKNWRKTPISVEMLNDLKIYCEEKGIRRGVLFQYHQNSLNNWLKEAVQKAGIEVLNNQEKVRWHSLRGSFVRYHSRKPMKWLMQTTGDTAKTLLEYYSEYSDEDLVRILDNKT